MTEYAKDVLVSTDWVAEHAQDAGIKLIEVNEDILLYHTGHIAGAQKLDWQLDLWDQVEREFIPAEQLSALLGRLGITPTDTVVLYGDKSNWWASYAYWFFTYNGVKGLKIMNGGRQKWVAEDRELSTEEVSAAPAVIRSDSFGSRESTVKYRWSIKSRSVLLMCLDNSPPAVAARVRVITKLLFISVSAC